MKVQQSKIQVETHKFTLSDILSVSTMEYQTTMCVLTAQIATSINLIPRWMSPIPPRTTMISSSTQIQCLPLQNLILTLQKMKNLIIMLLAHLLF